MRLIDADKLKKCFCDICNADFQSEPCEPDKCEPSLFIADAPTVDAVPVVHGTWDGWTCSRFYGCDDFGEPIYRYGVTYTCSNCYKGTAVKYNFCPHCGARMDAE